jgi:hypothetical protein
MDVQPGMNVQTIDGEPLGSIEHLVMDPASQRAMAVVVKPVGAPGRLVDPISLRPMTANTLTTDLTEAEFHSSMEFDAKDFRKPSESWLPPHPWTAGLVLWPKIASMYEVATPPSMDDGDQPRPIITEPVNDLRIPAEDHTHPLTASYAGDPYDPL